MKTSTKTPAPATLNTSNVDETTAPTSSTVTEADLDELIEDDEARQEMSYQARLRELFPAAKTVQYGPLMVSAKGRRPVLEVLDEIADEHGNLLAEGDYEPQTAAETSDLRVSLRRSNLGAKLEGDYGHLSAEEIETLRPVIERDTDVYAVETSPPAYLTF